jgi:hypothetical protein
MHESIDLDTLVMEATWRAQKLTDLTIVLEASRLVQAGLLDDANVRVFIRNALEETRTPEGFTRWLDHRSRNVLQIVQPSKRDLPTAACQSECIASPGQSSPAGDFAGLARRQPRDYSALEEGERLVRHA